jgi:hypothetical protein
MTPFRCGYGIIRLGNCKSSRTGNIVPSGNHFDSVWRSTSGFIKSCNRAFSVIWLESPYNHEMHLDILHKLLLERLSIYADITSSKMRGVLQEEFERGVFLGAPESPIGRRSSLR